MFRILALSILFSILFIYMPSIDAYAASASCTNCPPLYCENPDAAKQALDRKKKAARAQGIPERLIKLYDRLPQCIGCIEKTPDGFTIAWEIDPDAFEADRGYSVGAKKRSMAWNADVEKKLRDDMKRGIVKEFHIIHYAGPPCTCCQDESRSSVSQWDAAQSAKGSKIPGYNTNLDFHPDTTISYTNPKGLGKDPKDLTSIPKSFQRADTVTAPPLETFMEDPVEAVEAACKDCQKLVNKHNKLVTKINNMIEPLAKMKRDIHYSRQLIAQVWKEIEGIGKTAYTPETGKKTEELYDEIGGHQRALDKYQKRYNDKMDDFLMLNWKKNVALEDLKICEDQKCKPKDEPQAENAACPFSGNYNALNIGPNKEVGSGAQLKNEMKDKAKGMVMGGLNNMIGGSGVRFGGGKKGGQKGPKLDKDPTSGKFTDISTGKTDLEVRANYTDEGLVVSTNIDDTPGDGTFHAQWIQDSKGKIYLPTRFLILDLYRDWQLSVWWTHDKWVNGEHVYHDEGDSMTVGRDHLGSWTFFEGTKGIGNSIWNALGFATAMKGVQHLGSVYNVPPSAFDDPCGLRLVTHISAPKKDPVTTVPVVGDLFRSQKENDDELVLTITPSKIEYRD